MHFPSHVAHGEQLNSVMQVAPCWWLRYKALRLLKDAIEFIYYFQLSWYISGPPAILNYDFPNALLSLIQNAVRYVCFCLPCQTSFHLNHSDTFSSIVRIGCDSIFSCCIVMFSKHERQWMHTKSNTEPTHTFVSTLFHKNLIILIIIVTNK